VRCPDPVPVPRRSVPDALHVRRGQVDLVDDRNDLQVVLQRQIKVGQGLGLDPLGRVDEKKTPSQEARERETS
jgi:hypothetical protein